MVWNPDGDESPEEAPGYREELLQALELSEDVRRYYGLTRGDDGFVAILDGARLLSHSDVVKGILREFYKAKGKPAPKISLVREAPKKATLPSHIRASLDALYAKIDGLAEKKEANCQR